MADKGRNSSLLKPCPFCGGSVVMKENYLGQWNVMCENCGAIVWIGNVRIKGEVEKEWNRRCDNG